MTSSIKDPTVTDAMREKGARELCQGSPLETAHDVVERIYTAMRSMEGKPDPEGDGVTDEQVRQHHRYRNLWDDFQTVEKDLRNCALLIGHHYNSLRPVADALKDKLAALTAKPSLEPTRAELVEVAREIFEQGFRDGFVEAHVDENGPPDEEATLKHIDGVSLAEAWDANSDTLLKSLMEAARG